MTRPRIGDAIDAARPSTSNGLVTARSLYDVLGVAGGATHDEIHGAYRRLAKQHHPDSSHAGLDATMAEVNLAWSVLRDPRSRRDYDHQRATAAAVPPRPEPVHRQAANPRLLRALIIVSVAFLVLFAVLFLTIGIAQSPTS